MKKLRKNHLDKAIYGLEQTHPQYSMHLFLKRLLKDSKCKLFALILFTIAAVIIFPKIIFCYLSILYLTVQLFKLYVVANGAMASNAHQKLELPKQLPVYSILLPVYKEGKILPQLINAMQAIDYPKHLLDIKLLIEKDDQETIEAAAGIALPEYIEIIKVPTVFPRTKPKACNYGLQFCRGKYVVIYDAEDIPKSKQLKQVVAMFESCEEEVVCIQAKLTFYNSDENILTKLFSIEYGLLFNYFLQGLAKLNLPIPLGGTSNHFIREKLIELGGWDAFNVTEDADLGIRIYQRGYQTKMIDSITLEEAPTTYGAWIKQRTRWIKGHLLTSMMYLAHSGHLNLKAKLALFLTLFLPNIAHLLLPIYMLLSLFIDNFFCNLFYQIDISLGIMLPILYAYLVGLKYRWINKKEIILASPIYYLLLSIAAINSIIEIFKKPFHWNKTKHGISKFQ